MAIEILCPACKAPINYVKQALSNTMKQTLSGTMRRAGQEAERTLIRGLFGNAKRW